jgi:hypothetical protein
MSIASNPVDLSVLFELEELAAREEADQRNRWRVITITRRMAAGIKAHAIELEVQVLSPLLALDFDWLAHGHELDLKQGLIATTLGAVLPAVGIWATAHQRKQARVIEDAGEEATSATGEPSSVQIVSSFEPSDPEMGTSASQPSFEEISLVSQRKPNYLVVDEIELEPARPPLSDLDEPMGTPTTPGEDRRPGGLDPAD